METSRNHIVKAHILLIMMTIVGGLHFIIAKVLMPQYIAPSGMILVRVLSAFIFFGVIHYFSSEKTNFERQDYWRVIICGLLGVAVNQLMFFNGLALSKPINASLIMLVSPVEVLVISILVLKLKVKWWQILGVILGITGAFFLIFSNHTKQAHEALLGDIFIFINATAWSFYVVLVTPLMRKYPPFKVLTYTFAWGILFVIPFGYQDLVKVDWQILPIVAWEAFVYVIVLATFFNYYVNTIVLKYITPAQAGVYIYFQPVVASLVAVFLGRDDLTFQKIAFACLIFLGVYLVSKK